MQVRMCTPKRTAVKNTSRWDRAAMKDVSLGNAFRSELQRRPFQRLQLLNDIVREVGSRITLFPCVVHANNGFFNVRLS